MTNFETPKENVAFPVETVIYTCSHCQHIVEPGDNYCSQCGYKLSTKIERK